MSKVFASSEQNSTASKHIGERERTQSRCTALLCVLLLLFTRAHLPLLHSVTEYVHKDQTSARGSWNLCAWHGIVYTKERSACLKMCFRSHEFWHKYNTILLGDPESYKGQMRDLIPPANSGFAMGSLPSWLSPRRTLIKCLDHLSWLLPPLMTQSHSFGHYAELMVIGEGLS